MMLMLNWTNNSQFGLGSGYSLDRERGEKALQLEAGSSFVNKLVVSDPRLPFGLIVVTRELAAYGM
jgi:succinate-semialdehyde dehydrogenase/glutarate-semialdehyde dehydrogenase